MTDAEKKFREEQLQKVRSIKPTPKPPKPKAPVQKFNAIRRSGRGR